MVDRDARDRHAPLFISFMIKHTLRLDDQF